MAIVPDDHRYKDLIEGVLKERLNNFFMNMLFTPSSGLTGKEFRMMPVDENFVMFPTQPAEFVYHDEFFPNADVFIIKEELRNDPRNPNPKAGPRIVYTIRVDGRRVGNEYASLSIAKVFAEKMHEKLVKALKADLAENNPRFGAF